MQPKRDFLMQLGIPELADFVDRDPMPDSQAMKKELTITLNAACSWVELVSPVNLNVFIGFRDQQALVKYFLEQAYWDNVTVFGSKSWVFLDTSGFSSIFRFQVSSSK